MIVGRTTESRCSAPQRSSATRSPSALVKVYTSGQPSEVARVRPASTSWSFTHARRASSAAWDTAWAPARRCWARSEEHTSELQSRGHLVCRLLLEKKNRRYTQYDKKRAIRNRGKQ